MKKIFNYALYAGLLVTALTFTSCQKENYEVEPQDDQETMMASSATAKLLDRMVHNDGSWDNIVDGASCFDVRFPYTVMVNGLEVSINSREDLQTIEEILDALDTNEDILDILFPITIVKADYAEVTINSMEDLRELAAQCIEGGQDADIECIDIVYPVKFYKFDTSLAQASDYTVSSDKELRLFMAGLGENEIISIQYPVTFEMYDDTEVIVSSNSELASTLESAKEACDEDDDNDHNDDDFTKERLDNLLAECPWTVKEMHRDNTDHSGQYGEYLMNFSEDGGVTVIDRTGNVLNGEWHTRVAENRVLLKLEFDILVDFNLEWYIYEIHEGKIKLYSDDHNKIIMESVCDEINTDPNTLRGILKECHWVIKKVKVDGEEIIRLLGYEFEFKADNVVALSYGEVTSHGTWEITTNTQGRLVMAIHMGQEPGVSFEWPLSDLRNDRLVFEIPGTDYELILQRVCEEGAGDGDIMEIRNILMSGYWNISKFIKGDVDMTHNYSDFDFDFETYHKITVLSNQDPMGEGLWRVIRNSENALKVYLNLGEDLHGFGILTDDWKIVSSANNIVELKNYDDGSILVFEKK